MHLFVAILVVLLAKSDVFRLRYEVFLDHFDYRCLTITRTEWEQRYIKNI